MSARYFQQSHNNENLSIKCNDAEVKGTLRCIESIRSEGTLSLKSVLTFLPNTDQPEDSGKISLPALTDYPQATATNANVAASTGGVAPQQFIISTFETSPGVGGDLAAGASVSFEVFHSGIVANKTMVLCSKSVNANTLLNTIAWVTYTTDNKFIVTRHNFGATTASGSEKLIFKLIQSV